MTIQENLLKITQQIHAAELAAGRAVGSVQLLAVSKQQSADNIRAAFEAGQHCFGENYLQEALIKMAMLADLPIEWHFIGRLQANKTRLIAENFAWVHTVDRASAAQRLNDQRPLHLPPLQICIQVNLADETQKAVVSPDELPALAAFIAELPHLKLRGLMLIPPENLTDAEAFATFQQLAKLQQALHLDTLSMGMSHDFPVAIAAGATLVRIGTAIFGNRTKVLK